MELLEGMKVTIGSKYAEDYGYDDIVGTVCTYVSLFKRAGEGQLAEEEEVHAVKQMLSNRYMLEWYVRKADLYPAEPITNQLGTFYLRKETDI